LITDRPFSDAGHPAVFMSATKTTKSRETPYLLIKLIPLTTRQGSEYIFKDE
jgi:hypothetical protein